MKKLIFLFAITTILTACSSSDTEAPAAGNSFNRTALLTHWADNLIIPAFQNYSDKLALLQVDVQNFNADPSQENLLAARASWLTAYESFQKVMLFNIGKASDLNFKECADTYPTDVAGIEANVANGNYNLELLSQYSKQGFPALDYMLNGLGESDSAIIEKYSTDANAASYNQYLSDLVVSLKAKSTAIVTDWNTSYRSTFINSNGTAVSSSTNKMTNLFVKNFEKDIRTGKVGIPAGVFSNGTLFPEKVEGFYKKNISRTLLNTAIQAQQDFFNGKYFASSQVGPSLKSYLDDVNAVRDGLNLSAIINNQFDNIYATNAGLNENFSQQIISNNVKMLESYDAMQKNVVYFKLDMMQALNVTIDYVDGDGD